jgi:hypothetical protein
MHLCGLFAVRAYGIPYPPNHSLFVYRSIYDYHIPDVAGICAWCDLSLPCPCHCHCLYLVFSCLLMYSFHF